MPLIRVTTSYCYVALASCSKSCANGSLVWANCYAGLFAAHCGMACVADCSVDYSGSDWA